MLLIYNSPRPLVCEPVHFIVCACEEKQKALSIEWVMREKSLEFTFFSQQALRAREHTPPPTSHLRFWLIRFVYLFVCVCWSAFFYRRREEKYAPPLFYAGRPFLTVPSWIKLYQEQLFVLLFDGRGSPSNSLHASGVRPFLLIGFFACLCAMHVCMAVEFFLCFTSRRFNAIEGDEKW